MGVYHLKQTLYQIMLRISKILGKFRQTLKNLQTKIDKELILAALNYCLLLNNITLINGGSLPKELPLFVVLFK